LNGINLTKKWLKNCLQNHPSCHEIINSSSIHKRGIFPRRLVDVGEVPYDKVQSIQSPDELSINSLLSVRICTTELLLDGTEYITLSHCWGDGPTLILNNTTMKEFLQRIPESKLLLSGATTFRHAICVTRCLGFRYLWIDSLCINQEDEAEKLEEISRMGEIYSKAVLNISATGASSGSDGLFFHRRLDHMPCSKTSEYTVGQGTSHTTREIVAYTTDFAGEIVAHTTDFGDDVDFGHLNSRGWVFQERMLARRVLHFTRNQIYWECRSLNAAETVSCGHKEMRSGFLEQFKRWNVNDYSQSTNFMENASTVWAMLIAGYSFTDLTYPSDKLLALSAVAKGYAESRGWTPDEYLAGLWRRDLIRQLSWVVIAPWSSKREQEYVAPSWSWASITTEGVTWDFGSSYNEETPEIIKASIFPRDDDLFGRISSAILYIRGLVAKVERFTRDADGKMFISINGKINHRDAIHTHWDLVPEEFEGTRFSQSQNITPAIFYLMPLTLLREDEKVLDVQGLMLERKIESPGRYTRVGTFNMSQENDCLDESFYGMFQLALLGDSEYVERDSHHQSYVIGIV
jgi:Heterokaryon incompatibility protein (HET)